MNAYAIFAVNEHLEFLLGEAARNRATAPRRTGLRVRIATALANVRAAVKTPVVTVDSVLPQLNDYPYRS